MGDEHQKGSKRTSAVVQQFDRTLVVPTDVDLRFLAKVENDFRRWPEKPEKNES